MKTLQSSQPDKHIQLSKELRQQIKDGVFKPGDRLPSFAVMRTRHGISQDTWERAHRLLERDGLCVRERRRGVFVAQPQKAAVETIGFLSVGEQQPSRYPYWAHLLDGVRTAASQAGTEVLLIDSATEAIRWEKINGVIAVGADLQNFSKPIPLTMPRVSLIQPTKKVPSVVADECRGIHDTIEHLVALGHRRIAYLMMGTPMRVEAYRDALVRAGIRANSGWVWDMRQCYPKDNFAEVPSEKAVSFVELGRANMRAWLQRGWNQSECTALLTQNDETALGALEALREAGINVPGDISIVGFDGTEVAEYSAPPLTTVEVPLREIGAVGLRTLLQMCRDEKVPRLTTLPTLFKVRETTLAPSS